MSHHVVHVLVLGGDDAAERDLQLPAAMSSARVATLAEARDALQRTRLDCVVVDVGPQGGEPVSAVAAIRASAPHVAVVVRATAAQEESALAAVRAGADGHLIAGIDDAEATGRAIRFAVARKRAERDRVRQALHDPLTGALTLLGVEEALPEALQRAERRGTRIGLVFLDLDGVDAIAAERGGAAADDAVVQMGERLREVARDADLLARPGPTRFLVVCEDLEIDAAVRLVADRVEEALARPVALRDGASVRLRGRVTSAAGDGTTPAASLLRGDGGLLAG